MENYKQRVDEKYYLIFLSEEALALSKFEMHSNQ